jgi:predicted RNase H-like nuclease (RuvC/YqgF family)
MKGQKQSRTDALEKRMAAVTNILQQLINESERLNTMVSGHHQILKQLPGYEDAINELKKKVAEKPSEGEEAKSDGKTSK